MPEHIVDVDGIAETAERLGPVTPDCQGPDGDDVAEEIVIVLSIAGGNLQDVGVRRADMGTVRVVLVDHDNCEAGDEPGETYVTALENWSREPDSALVKAAGELPGDLRRELGLAEGI